MTLEQYGHMMVKLKKLNQICKQNFKLTTEEFGNLSINEAINRVEQAKKMQATMDSIFQTELYHIIGMGDMDLYQETMFMEEIKELGSYRGYVKAIAFYKINPLPKIPEESSYKCKYLGIDLTKENLIDE